MSGRPNVFALGWVDLALGLAEDYERLWESYTQLQRDYLALLLKLREERAAWARAGIEKRFATEERAA